MGAVHRLLALEADDGAPAELPEARPGVGGVEPIRLQAPERRPADQVDRAGQQDVATRELVLRAGMPRIVGAVDEPGLLAPVIGEASLEVQDAERLLPRTDQGDVLALVQRVGGSPPHRQGDRERPHEPVGEAHPFQNRPVVGLAEEPFEGAVGADGEELEIGHHPGVERDPCERGRSRPGVLTGVAAKDTIDQPPTVRDSRKQFLV